ncbi:MAG TPA: hypothetical protein VMN36_02670 [Verrucomicrobiales bacterium]|nr:hypothetical protein [Verrucomicrobiales bacterium]
MPDSAQPFHVPTPRGFACSVVLLAVFAAGQLWLWFTAPSHDDQPADSGTPKSGARQTQVAGSSPSLAAPVSSSSLLLPQAAEDGEEGIPAVPPPSEEDPDFPPPAPPAPDLVALSGPPYPPIEDRAVLKHMALAADLDHAGDMLGAIRNLRAAETVYSGHPEILYQLGSAYLRIGNTVRGYSYLNELLALGPARAGELALLAKIKLEGGQPDHTGPRITGGPFRIGEALTRHLPAENGERVSLLVAIRTHPSAEVAPEDLQIYVHFYELAGGRNVVHSPVEPSHAWRTAPVDWKGATEELLEFTYSRVEPEGAAPPGSTREYYGHVIKLYYADELQDMVVQPRVLYEHLQREERPFLRDDRTADLEANPLFDIDDP